MGCKGSKQTEVENTYGELNKNIQKTMMLRAALNLGESSYGIQVGLSKTHKETSQLLVMRKRFHNFFKKIMKR